MKSSKDPQAIIIIEETHHYHVDLGIVSDVVWQKAVGSVQVKIPYDGAVLKQVAPEEEQYAIGHLEISQENIDEPEILPIVLGTDPSWQVNIKSNKTSVTTASYDIQEPGDPLVSVDGVVLDDVLAENGPSGDDSIFGNIDAYDNPLALKLSLWVPDLLAETRPSEVYELETMLLRGESTQRIFISSINWLNYEQKLAENLVALANTAGGTILLGVDKNGNITGVPIDLETKRHVLTTIIKSALRSSPSISIWQVSEIRHTSGKMVMRIDIPKAGTAIHQLDGTIFKRQGHVNNQEPFLSTTLPASAFVQSLSESSLEGIFDRDEAGTVTFRSRDDVVVCNASNGIKNLRLGAHLCGLINSGKRTGRIIVTDLPVSQNERTTWLRPQEDIEKVLGSEMEKMLPLLDTPVIEHRHLGNQHIAIIHLPAWQLPIALYDGQGYIWQNPVLNEYKIEEIFDKYLELTGSRGEAPSDQDVYLEQATLNSPIRPPEELEKNTVVDIKEGLAYDVEYQARVWEPRPFKRDEDTVGFSAQLIAPLRHVSLTLGDAGKVVMASPQATGQMRVRLKDVLMSGLEVTSKGNDENQWLNTIPVVKRTYLQLDYNARLNELFHRRRKTSLLRFLIPDVLLDRERVDDLAQVCADIGFRVYDKELFDTAPSTPAKATIQGIRSFGYYDIELLVGLLCKRSELTRELHYDGWRDSKSTYTAMLDVRVKLWGTGEGVEGEIGRLQLALYQTISQRLQHLRAE